MVYHKDLFLVVKILVGNATRCSRLNDLSALGVALATCDHGQAIPSAVTAIRTIRKLPWLSRTLMVRVVGHVCSGTLYALALCEISSGDWY